MLQPARALLLGLALALLALAPAGWAETVRVASWSFPASSATSAEAEARVDEAAVVLKKLNPDVILLESVRDWQTCSALAEALRPTNYTVLVCSAFRNETNASAVPQQVAILSKHKGYFSWSEPWRVEGEPAPPGGFAFAAIQLGKHRVGFFAVDPQAVGTGCSIATYTTLSRQWALAVATYKSWVANRLEAVVVAGGELAPDSSEAALTTGFLNAPLHSPMTLTARAALAKASSALVPAGLTADAKTVPGLVLVGPQVACALDLDAPKAPVAQAARPKAPVSATNSRPVTAATNPSPAAATPSPQSMAAAPSVQPIATAPKPQTAAARTYPYLLLGGALAALLAAIGFWSWRRRARAARQAALLTTGGVSSYTLVVSEASLGSPAAPAAVQASSLQPVSPQAVPGRASRAVEVWPPGPVLLSPELQRAAAQDRAGLRAQLAQWLKQKLLQRLLADRSELLKTQQAATGKLLSFEERLARIELQLQQQNQVYEQRILELNRDLAAAKEENRELIRARIAQVKAEMEAARARLLAQARAGER